MSKKTLGRVLSTKNKYDIDPHVAEIYDRHETGTDDIYFIRRLVQNRGKLRILEPFCGTGRILIPLAEDGHELIGIDLCTGILDRARSKSEKLAKEVRDRITLVNADVLSSRWPANVDMVILGANCFYELGLPEEQEKCIRKASEVLKQGGYLYIENDNMEGQLDKSWQNIGVKKNGWPSGVCSDGTRVETTVETLWVDKAKRLWHARRETTIHFPDGKKKQKSYETQTHPSSAVDIKEWLRKYCFEILGMYSGPNKKSSYRPGCDRAVFWARKR